MVCSNEMLKVSLDDLKVAVRAGTEEQRLTRSSLDGLHATFETWRITRCDEHHSAIHELKEKVSNNDREISRNIGKAAGIIGAIMVVLQITGLYFTYLKLAPMLAGS